MDLSTNFFFFQIFEILFQKSQYSHTWLLNLSPISFSTSTPCSICLSSVSFISIRSSAAKICSSSSSFELLAPFSSSSSILPINSLAPFASANCLSSSLISCSSRFILRRFCGTYTLSRVPQLTWFMFVSE